MNVSSPVAKSAWICILTKNVPLPSPQVNALRTWSWTMVRPARSLCHPANEMPVSTKVPLAQIRPLSAAVPVIVKSPEFGPRR